MLLAGLLLLLLLFAPTLYVRGVMARHGRDRPDLPGTGGELARHLLDAAGLAHVAVERSDQGDHYDPLAQAVRLSPGHLDGRSVTAVAVAAHEVAHAVQHRDGSPMLLWRLRLVRWVVAAERVAVVVFIGLPLAAMLLHMPLLMLGLLGFGIGTMALGILVHALTLPVELDASFRRALPALSRGGYLADRDLRRARSVLWAAALTYLAGALVSLLNVFRWGRMFR